MKVRVGILLLMAVASASWAQISAGADEEARKNNSSIWVAAGPPPRPASVRSPPASEADWEEEEESCFQGLIEVVDGNSKSCGVELIYSLDEYGFNFLASCCSVLENATTRPCWATMISRWAPTSGATACPATSPSSKATAAKGYCRERLYPDPHDDPYEGGSFAYLRVELGDLMAFIAAGSILLECLVSGTAVSRAWTSYFATLINRRDDLRIHVPRLAENYNYLDPISVGITVLTGIGAIFRTMLSSRFKYVISMLQVTIILFIIIAGLSHVDPSNLTTDFAPYGACGVFQASAVLFFAYVGFDAVATMAGETKNPGRDFPIGLVGSVSIITLLYCSMALALTMMQPYGSIDPDAPFTVAFDAVGMRWAKYPVALAALISMTTVLLAAAIVQTRYVTSPVPTSSPLPRHRQPDPEDPRRRDRLHDPRHLRHLLVHRTQRPLRPLLRLHPRRHRPLRETLLRRRADRGQRRHVTSP